MYSCNTVHLLILMKGYWGEAQPLSTQLIDNARWMRKTSPLSFVSHGVTARVIPATSQEPGGRPKQRVTQTLGGRQLDVLLEKRAAVEGIVSQKDVVNNRGHNHTSSPNS